MLDARVDARNVQIAARHADPQDMRYDRAQNNLDRHPTFSFAAYVAPGTRSSAEKRAFESLRACHGNEGPCHDRSVRR